MRDIDSEVRLVATLRRAARERGGPLPSIDVVDALLDERRADRTITRESDQLLVFEQSNSNTGANSEWHLGTRKMEQLGA